MKKWFYYLLPSLVLMMAETLTSESTLYHDLAGRISSLPVSKKEIRVAVIPRPGHNPELRPYLLHVSRSLASELASLTSYRTPDREKIIKYILENDFYRKEIISTARLSNLGRKFSLDLIVYCDAKTVHNKRQISADVISPFTGRVLLSAASWRISGREKNQLKSSSKRDFSTEYSIQGFSIFKSDERIYTIIGRLANVSVSTFTRPVLTITLHFPTGSRVIVAKASCDRDLAPAETLPFRGIINNVPDLPPHFQVLYQPEISRHKKNIPKLFGSRVSLTFRKNTSEYLLQGNLENKEIQTVYFPSVIVSFFDKDNRFCGSARGFCRLKKLPPSGKSTFRVRVKRKSLKADPESYRLQYAGQLSP